jgi:hypothetical protein
MYWVWLQLLTELGQAARRPNCISTSYGKAFPLSSKFHTTTVGAVIGVLLFSVPRNLRKDSRNVCYEFATRIIGGDVNSVLSHAQ